jgi:hypothetical protein
MRRILPALAIAAAAAVATPALAQQDERYPTAVYVAPVAGAAVGTAVGVGLYNGWLGSSAFVAAAPITAVGAAAVGGVAGIGTIALIDAATQHCRGFGIFVAREGECVNGVWVGDLPPPRHLRRHG